MLIVDVKEFTILPGQRAENLLAIIKRNVKRFELSMFTPQEFLLNLCDSEGNVLCPQCRTLIASEMAICMTCTNRCCRSRLYANLRLNIQDGQLWAPGLDLCMTSLAALPGGEDIARAIVTWICMLHMSVREYHDP